MLHITVRKPPHPPIIISPLSAAGLLLFSSLLSSSSSVRPLRLFHPALVLSDFFFPPPLQKPCLKPDIVCQAPSDSLQSWKPPLLPVSPQLSKSPVRKLTSPTWESSSLPPLLFFVSTFSYFALSVYFLPSFNLSASPPFTPGLFSRLLNLLPAIIALFAKCDTTSIFPPLTPHVPLSSSLSRYNYSWHTVFLFL